MSEGSESQNQSSKKHDLADKKEAIPFKKRARFLVSNDIEEAGQEEINPGTNNNKPSQVESKPGTSKNKEIIASTSGHTDAAKNDKAEVVPNKKSETHDKDAAAATLLLVAMRKSKGIATACCVKNNMKRSIGDKNPVDDIVYYRKIRTGEGSRSRPQGDGATGVGDAKQVVGKMDIIEREGGGCNKYARRSKEERNKGKKPMEYAVSSIVHVGKTPSVGEHGKQVHKADPVKTIEGSSRPSPGDATLIVKDGVIREGDAVVEERPTDTIEEGEIREDDADLEEGEVDSMECGDNENKSSEGKKPVDIDVNVVCDGKQVHEAELVINVVGSSRHSPVHTATETKNDEYCEGGSHEQERVEAMEDVVGDENNTRNSEPALNDVESTMVHDGENGGGGMSLVDIDINVSDGDNGGGEMSQLDIDINASDGGNGGGGISLVDIDINVSAGSNAGGGMALYDIDMNVSDGEQVDIANPVTNHEGSSYHSLVNNTTTENMNDGNSLGNHHEMEQPIPMNDIGDGNDGINATLGENQVRKGKRPIEYIEGVFIQDGASGSGGMKPEGNDENTPIFSGDRERLEFELAEKLAILVHIEKERESDNHVPRVGGEGVVHTNLTLGRGSNAIRERNHDDQIQHDGGNNNDIAIPQGYMHTQGGGEVINLNPLIIRTQNCSIHELSEESQRGIIVKRKTKHGCDGGVGGSGSVPLANNHTLRLFGVDIPCQPQPEPTVVLRLLGVDFVVPEEELQAASTEIKDGGSSENHAQGGHGGGELSVPQRKYGLRLMGFDL